MFLTHFFFELRYWLRGWMVWIFLLVLGAMFFGAASSDQITVGAALENTYRNATYVIQNFYVFASFLAVLMTTAFVNSAAGRDFTSNTWQMLFTTPMGKWGFLMGRYWGAVLISSIPLLAVSLAVILAQFMPWVDAERWGPIRWDAHVMGFFVFGLPNTILIGGVLFMIAVLTRSTAVSFIGALMLMVAYGVSQAFLAKLDREQIAGLLDPFGIRAFGLITKYWTVSERNGSVVGFEGQLLWNRLIWIGVGMLCVWIGCHFFRMGEKPAGPAVLSRRRKPEARPDDSPAAIARSASQPLPDVKLNFGAAAEWSQFLSAASVEFWSMVKTASFIVITFAALLNCVPSMALGATEQFGTTSFPVTYRMLDMIRGQLYIFLVALVTYFAGLLVWQERETKCDEIHDAMPTPNWVAYASKFVALTGALVLIMAVTMIAAIIVQAAHGYTRFQLSLYLREIYLLDLFGFLSLGVLAFFFHVLSPNKYVGYFSFIIFVIANAFLGAPLNLATLMLRFGDTPSYTYSDFYGYAPYVAGLSWFSLYWTLFAVLLAIATILLWPRGKETSLAQRFRQVRERFAGVMRPFAAVAFAAWAATAGWVFYNTKILHKIEGPKDVKARLANYEKKYKKYEPMTLPRVQSVKYWIDIFPETRNVTMRAEQVLENKSAAPITEFHLMENRALEYSIDIERAKRKSFDKEFDYAIYTFNPPLEPGQRALMKFTVKSNTRGFENQVSQTQLVQNGTFFNNQMAPRLGYDPDFELSERNDRKDQGLKEKDKTMLPLERNCTSNCMNTYISNSSDWVDVETVISTSPDQIAVAPGSLIREWNENGRRYFQYKLDHASLNFYSFISARYEVAREDWNGVKLEVYYHPEHKWNVDKMLRSMRKALEYLTAHYTPYAHKQARIIEFPRFASFAQAFPGTMPYSEGIGFIANLEDPEDIDYVFYVTAHEVAHQWWAHQVIGANMQGATLLSETMAQYVALMVMEHEYGRDTMRKFLRYEMDRYLRSRGRELLKERPLLSVESGQGYIHYNKGSVALYYLKEMIGEDKVNRALKRVADRFAYAQPPYPTSHDLVDALREETPADLRYLIKDLFEDITLFSNRTRTATFTKNAAGKFDVTIEIEVEKLKADEKGSEQTVPMDDWVEIGAFAKPPEGKKYGKTLHRQRVKMKSGKQTFQFTVDEQPDTAGVDPFALLVDRIPNDNMKKVRAPGS